MTQESKDYLKRRIDELYDRTDLDAYDVLNFLITLIDEIKNES